MSVQLGIEHLLSVEPRFQRWVEAAPSCNLNRRSGAVSTFETLAGCIFSQQLSGKAAKTIEGRFIARFGDGNYPSPERVLSTSIEELREVGLSRPKATYLQDLAKHALDDLPTLDALYDWPEEQVIERLTRIKGIGRWSVEMLLMFDFGRLDVWPIDDLGVQKGLARVLELDDRPKPKQMASFGERFAPYRSICAWYCWRALEND